MIAAVLGLAWAAVVATGVAQQRPVARRVDGLRPVAARRVRRAMPTLQRVVLYALGFLIAVAVAGPQPAAAAIVAVIVMSRVWPRLVGRRAERRHLARVEAQLPEVVDLLVLAVGAGLNVPLALEAVSRAAHGELADEIAAVVAATRQGHRLADALDTLPTRAGEAVRPMVAALVATERYGAPLGPGLERLSDEVRAARRRRADIAARQVSVKLLFPLVLCILPAFALLTVAPLIAAAIRSLNF